MQEGKWDKIFSLSLLYFLSCVCSGGRKRVHSVVKLQQYPRNKGWFFDDTLETLMWEECTQNVVV